MARSLLIDGASRQVSRPPEHEGSIQWLQALLQCYAEVGDNEHKQQDRESLETLLTRIALRSSRLPSAPRIPRS